MKFFKNFSLGKTQILKGLVALGILWLFACATDAGESFDPAETCPAEGLNAYGFPNRGTFVDSRDGQEYRYITIGEQIWMDQNLNYWIERSTCPGGLDENCIQYGRLYSLLYHDKSYDSTYGFFDFDIVNHVCPEGWHVPTLAEWRILVDKMGGKENMQNDKCMNISESDGGGRAYQLSEKQEYKYDDFGGAYWWTQTMARPKVAYYVEFEFDEDDFRAETDNGAFFIRCTMDL